MHQPGRNRAPGQDTSATATGSSGPLATPRNGRYNFTVTTDPVGPVPATPTCPNPQWTPVIVGVTFGDATLSLFEDGLLVDTTTVLGPFYGVPGKRTNVGRAPPSAGLFHLISDGVVKLSAAAVSLAPLREEGEGQHRYVRRPGVRPGASERKTP